MGNPNPKPKFKKGNTASLKHGVRALQTTGKIPEARQSPAIMARVEEIRRNLADAEGVAREQEQITEVALEVVFMAMDWIREKRAQGQPLDRIPIFNKLPAFLNTAGRQLERTFAFMDRLGKVDAVEVDYEAILERGDE